MFALTVLYNSSQNLLHNILPYNPVQYYSLTRQTPRPHTSDRHTTDLLTAILCRLACCYQLQFHTYLPLYSYTHIHIQPPPPQQHYIYTALSNSATHNICNIQQLLYINFTKLSRNHRLDTPTPTPSPNKKYIHFSESTCKLLCMRP